MTGITERDRVAIVTGGSTGLGYATVALLAARGMRVAAVARDRARLDSALAALDQPLQDRVVGVTGDVGEPHDAEDILGQTVDRFGQLDVLVNCAGVSLPQHQPLVETSTEEWERLLKTNLTGTFLMCRAALEHLADSPNGQIVNVLSTVAYRPAPGAAIYAATKYGARALTESMIEEYRGTTVRISSVSPSKMNTAIWDHKLRPPSEAEREAMMAPEDVAEVVGFILARPPSVHIPNILVAPWNTES